MKKIKWSYDKKGKYWYVIETAPYANDGLEIRKQNGHYKLKRDYLVTIGWFKKLSSAKTVANLLRHG